jgi:hypothetical protein
MFVEFDDKDIKRAVLVDPAYYRVRIEDIVTKASDDGKSTNIRLEGVIIKNADDNSEKFAGVPTPYLWQFNTKAIGMMIPVLQAVDPTYAPQTGVRVPIDNLKGAELEVFIGRGEWNNNLQNQMTNRYRPVAEKRTLGGS